MPETRISLLEAHRDRGIESKHITRFGERLLETLLEIGIEEQDADEVYKRIAAYSNEVLGETAVDE